MRYLLLFVLCAPLHAAFDDFPRVAHRNLFAADDPYSAKPSSSGERDEDNEDEDYVEDDWADTGWFALGFWGTPYTRFTNEPYGHAAGVGLEFTFHFGQAFALVAGVGVWSADVDARDDDGVYTAEAGGVEVELGFRWRFLRWDSGALYTDARAAFAVFDGPGAVRATSSIGGGPHFGIELGSPMFRVFFETGFEIRGALNYSNSGWLRTGATRDDAGWYFDLLRVGLRIYF